MEAAFLALLAADAGLVALLGTGADQRVWAAGKLPQKPTFPAITYQNISEGHDYHQQGDDGVPTFRIQFNLYGTTAAQVQQLRDAFITATSGKFNIVHGSPPYHFKGVFVAGSGRDFYDVQLDAAGPKLMHKQIDLFITASPA